MSLALATLIFEWRRYMAAVVALALSGALILVMLGLFTGIVHSVFATTERSRADLFIMPVNTPTLTSGSATLPARVKPIIYRHPNVTEVRSWEGGSGLWINMPGPGKARVETFVVILGVDTDPGAVTLPFDYPETVRAALMQPRAVVIDKSKLSALGVERGDYATINGRLVRVAGVLENYQNINQTNVITSRETMYLLGAGAKEGETGPLMVRVDDPARAEIVRDQLDSIANGSFKAWTKAQLSMANEKAVLSQQVIGVMLVFLTIISILIGIGITSQTLRGAIQSNIREFASLRALGISMGSLRLIVMELSAWVGVAGILAAGVLTAVASVAAAQASLPLIVRPQPAMTVAVMLIVIAMASGAFAMGVLKKSNPADLLR